MITPEERESIINEAVERAIKLTPDLSQNLVMQRVSEDRLKLSFLEKLLADDERYKKWIQFIKEVVQKHEMENPGDSAKALELALPEIKLRIEQMEGLNFGRVERPVDLTFKQKPDAPEGIL